LDGRLNQEQRAPKMTKTFLALLLSASTILADTVNLAWDPSPSLNVTTIRIYYSSNVSPATSGAPFVTLPASTTITTITNVGIGICRFQATALLPDGTESLPSNTA